MIFKPELVEKILAGEKTETRRAVSLNPRSPWSVERCRYRAGRHYALQPGRSAHAVAQILVTDVRKVRLGGMNLDDARREGFASVEEFVDYWTAMQGSYDVRALVWAVTFRVAGTPTRAWQNRT